MTILPHRYLLGGFPLRDEPHSAVRGHNAWRYRRLSGAVSIDSCPFGTRLPVPTTEHDQVLLLHNRKDTRGLAPVRHAGLTVIETIPV